MGIKWEKFKVKDVAFLAVMAALLILCAGVSMPVMTVPIFGIQSMVTAIFYGAFATIALLKVRKPGALCVIIILNAVVLLMMSPTMFFHNATAAIITELIVMLIFRSYEKDLAVILSAGLVIPLTLPVSVFFYAFLYNKTMAEIFTGTPVVVAVCCIGTVVLSFVGVAIGMKIGKELKKAGKLK